MKSNNMWNSITGKIKLFISVLFIAATLSGCIESLLDTTPYDKIGDATMWTNEAYTEMGLAGIYSVLYDGYTHGSTTGRQMYEMDQYGMTMMTRGSHAWKSGSITPSNGLFENVWKALYTGVVRANDLIKNMPELSPVAEDVKARYVAEAKFLRAYYYFRLNQLWKGVPVYLEEVTLDEMYRPRETESKVWEVILDDLTAAINEPKFPDKYDAGKEDYGHVTKGAAYALRGKVYLYMGEYEKAISDFEKVATCGYGLFNGSYFDLFKEKNEQCEEMIFSIQYTNVEKYGSDWQLHLGSRSAVGGVGCWNSYVPTNDLVDLYETIDGKPFDWDDYLPGFNSMNHEEREVFFLRDTVDLEDTFPGITEAQVRLIGSAVKTRLGALKAETQALYLPKGNEARIRKVYENRDPRLEMNVITPYATFRGYLGSGVNVVTSRWPYSGIESSPVRDLRTDSTNDYYYLYRKFVYEGDELAPSERGYGPNDFPLIRYGDVLLMWAEALTELNKDVNAKAIELVNQIRSRAGVALLNSSAATQVKDYADLIERIRNERRRELFGEGVIYFDERRWRTLEEKAFYPGNGRKMIWGKALDTYVWLGDHAYLWPIPMSERQKNPNLEQNPGWGN